MKFVGTTLLSHLLPYEVASKRNGEIRIGLKEYQALLVAFLEATAAWARGDLCAFDSLVGENACQIRAIWIALLASNDSIDVNDLNHRLTSALEKVNRLLEPKSIEKLMRGEDTLKAVLEQHALEIYLTFQETFLIQTYLLTEVKSVRKGSDASHSIFLLEAADPKQLKRFGDVSSEFAKHLLSRLRQQLASASVAFVAAHASAPMRPMVSHSFKKEHNALSCIPMFWTYKILLETAKASAIPFILHAKFLTKSPAGFTITQEERLFFKPSGTGAYALVEPTVSDLDRPACVVQGVVVENQEGILLSKSQWIALIKEKGLIDVILAGAADHRQYPDPALDALFTELNDEEYEGYKALAKSAGFSTCNPTGFFIQHVYALRAGEMVEAAPQKTHLQEETYPRVWDAFSSRLHVAALKCT